MPVLYCFGQRMTSVFGSRTGGRLDCFMLGVVLLLVGLVMLVARGWGDAGLRALIASPERAVGALVVEPIVGRSGAHTLTAVKVEMTDGSTLSVTVPAEHETEFLAALGTRGEILRLPERRG